MHSRHRWHEPGPAQQFETLAAQKTVRQIYQDKLVFLEVKSRSNISSGA